LRGKPTVINWWATWCTACVVEIPGLDSLVNIFGAQISFLAIAQNSSEEVLTFLKNRSFRFSHTLGNDSTIQALGGSVPRTIVLDTNGTVVLDLIGGSRDIYKQVEQAVNKIMRN